MLRLHRRCHVSMILLISLLALMGSSARGQTTDAISNGKRIVRKLFPELKNRGLFDIIEDGGRLDDVDTPTNSFNLLIFEPVNYAGPDTCPSYLTTPRDIRKQFTNKCPPFILTAGFMFSVEVDNRILQFGAGGPAANDNRLDAVAKEVDANPKWGENEIQAALEKAGARFGPRSKEELIRSLPMPTLNSLLGSVKIVSVEFNARDQNTPEHSSANLTWAVILMSHMEGKKDLRYYAAFEPFDGKLIFLHRNPPVQ